MKKLIHVALCVAAASVFAGCTALKEQPDGSITYVNGIFSKKIGSIDYEKEKTVSTNGVVHMKARVRLKNVDSSAADITEAAVRGAVQGAK